MEYIYFLKLYTSDGSEHNIAIYSCEEMRDLFGIYSNTETAKLFLTNYKYNRYRSNTPLICDYFYEKFIQKGFIVDQSFYADCTYVHIVRLPNENRDFIFGITFYHDAVVKGWFTIHPGSLYDVDFGLEFQQKYSMIEKLIEHGESKDPLHCTLLHCSDEDGMTFWNDFYHETYRLGMLEVDKKQQQQGCVNRVVVRPLLINN